jgi:DNA (cytosine-5)-methyltransferase 1
LRSGIADPLQGQLFMNLWPAPTARDHRSIHASQDTHHSNSRPLSEAAGLWAAPLASELRQRPGRFAQGVASLPAQATLWATPTVADTEGGRLSRSGERADELLLRGQALRLVSHPDPLAMTTGEKRLPSGLVLNPWFVERLMGWPTGWTACDFSATALSHWRRRMRSELWRLGSPPTLPAQLSLFG